MILLCLALIPLALALGAALTWLLAQLGERWQAFDRPGSEAHKQHVRAVPNTGGIAIFNAIALPVLAGLVVVWIVPVHGWRGLLAPFQEHVAGLREQTPAAVAIVACLAILHALGLLDDRRRLGPGVKLAVQFAVAAVLALGFDVRIFQFLDPLGVPGLVASVALTVLWMVAITNAMNMLDNMDGLAGGVGAIIAALYLAATLIGGQWFIAALCALLLGALVGFLIFNFPPARIFMGDGGSLVLGFLLAVISVRTTYLPVDAPLSEAPHVMLMPLILLAVPLYDLVSVSLLRLRQGRSPFVGDQQHFSHRLVRRGFSKRAAVLIIWLATFAAGAGGVMFANLQPWQALLVALQTLAVIAVLAILER